MLLFALGMLVLYISFVKFDFGICIVGDFEEEKKRQNFMLLQISLLYSSEIKGTPHFSGYIS